MKLCKLTSVTGEVLFINPMQVIHLRATHPSGTAIMLTEIKAGTSVKANVIESFREVEAMLNEAMA